MIFKNLSIIYCSNKENLIGLNLVYTDDTGNKIQIMPWGTNNVTDLKYFKSLTINNTVIMGFNTFQTIGKPLFNRKNIVITKRHAEQVRKEFPNVLVLESTDELYDYLCNQTNYKEQCFIIGGAQLFTEFWSSAYFIYQTEIDNYKQTVQDNEIESKIYIQNINQSKYELIERLYVDEETDPNIKYIRNVYKHKIL